jgi:hypothetical protein
VETPGSISGSGPTSLVAAEIHLEHKPAVIYGGWPHCNIQVMCHPVGDKISFQFNSLFELIGTVPQLSPLISGNAPKN